ncbi:HepT-like ribonuclease domain-containing protein [Clostridium sp.]|uniref:DUF86 domain-containing protein n=1 Tax=Clostridium sp. TaxID=1506 RepID=UPI002FC936CA
MVLFKDEKINNELRDSLCNMAGFRNILVHDYMKFDRNIVYHIINNNLKDIELFIKNISAFI